MPYGKRSASQAELPTSINHQAKRPMYAQTVPLRRNTYGIIIQDAPEGQSLLNRWVSLLGDTFRALWEKSADVASRVIPPTPDMIPEASIPLPESPEPRARTGVPSRLPIPSFDDTNTLASSQHLASTSSLFPSATHSSTSALLYLSSSTSGTPAEDQQYPKHKHIHMSQHRRKVEEHNRREMERLRMRRTSLSDEMDMEKTLSALKRTLAKEKGHQLAKQWETEKATGEFQSDLDSFMGLQSYRQMVLDESGSKAGIPTSPSLSSLSQSLSTEARPRLTSQQRRSSFNLQRTLQIAQQSLNEQQPLFPISFEKLRVSGIRKDREIDKRIRDAMRLPTKLPPKVAQEVKLLRTKRGVISKFAKEQVSHSELARLDPHGTVHWLNDEIINFYGALILDRSEKLAGVNLNSVNGAGKKRKGKAPEYLNVHYFSTFFWPKIEMGYKESRLNKWTKKFDIFQKDVVLIPVNHGNVHWTLAAINFRKRRVESYDSMGIYRKDVYAALRTYLQEEHMDKKKKPFDFTGWIDHYDENTPQQENGWDCGVFTCQFMESLSRGVDAFVFDQQDMVYIRDRMTYEISRGKLWDDSDS